MLATSSTVYECRIVPSQSLNLTGLPESAPLILSIDAGQLDKLSPGGVAGDFANIAFFIASLFAISVYISDAMLIVLLHY